MTEKEMVKDMLGKMVKRRNQMLEIRERFDYQREKYKIQANPDPAIKEENNSIWVEDAGYAGFVSVFVFNDQDELIEIQAWE